MKVIEIVRIMNIADVGIRSTNLEDDLVGIKKIDMHRTDTDPILKQYGNREVVSLENIAKTGDVIVI